jgi:hypothetical protein
MRSKKTGETATASYRRRQCKKSLLSTRIHRVKIPQRQNISIEVESAETRHFTVAFREELDDFLLLSRFDTFIKVVMTTIYSTTIYLALFNQGCINASSAVGLLFGSLVSKYRMKSLDSSLLFSHPRPSR